MSKCTFILEKNSESDLGEQQQGTKRGIGEKPKQAKKKRLSDKEDSDSEESESSTDSEEDNAPAKTTLDNEGKKVSSKGNDFEVVPVEDNSKLDNFLSVVKSLERSQRCWRLLVYILMWHLPSTTQWNCRRIGVAHHAK